jgi:glutathione S-transferase
MTITVYGAYRSTCTKRVLATLHEKGLKYELQPIDLATGEQKVRVRKSWKHNVKYIYVYCQSPKYLEEKQPFGVIPVLVDDGFQIYG